MSALRAAVFGSSEPSSGDPLYDLALDAGRRLARAGYEVVTGGYGGVMEAACRGAREEGGTAWGVVCDIFSEREPNAFLSRRVDTPDLYARTRELIDRSDAYLILHGRAGTLAEFAWIAALARAGCLPRRPVVALGDSWRALFDVFDAREMLDPATRDRFRWAADAAGAVAWLDRWRERGGHFE